MLARTNKSFEVSEIFYPEKEVSSSSKKMDYQMTDKKNWKENKQIKISKFV